MLLQRLKNRYRRWRITRHAIPDSLWREALDTVPLVARLTHSQRVRLRELATLFLLDKRFSAAAGLTLVDPIRIRIAAHACLPVLELGLDYYANFKGIVVYPDDFRVNQKYADDAGVVHEEISELCGQSLTQGPMVLSWGTMQTEQADAGQNLVVHECAHKLDALNGGPEGFPPLHAPMSISTWSAVMHAAYDTLCRMVDADQETRIDPYAAENPAEFFAVVSETFFTRPDVIAEDMPQVYEQLAAFYRQNPYQARH